MGTTQIPTLPKTREWVRVVRLIQAGADAAQVARAVIRAAADALAAAARDEGVAEAAWLLAQLPTAAREGDFAAALRDCGMGVPDAPGLMDVVVAVSDAMDDRFPNNRGRTDVTEIAQTAAAEAVAATVGAKTAGFFGAAPPEVQKAVAGLATVKKFGAFVRTFFARLVFKCLDSFVSRATPAEVGGGKRFTTLAQEREFARELETHCWDCAFVIERFAGEWRAKAKWVRGEVDRPTAEGFAQKAMRKLVGVLRDGGAADDR